MTTELKICTRCKRALPITEFHRMNKSSETLRPRCRQCRNEERLQWENKNIDKVRERRRLWRENNPELKKKYDAISRNRHREERNAYDREWRMKNQDVMKKLKSEWRAKNPQYDTERRKSNPKWGVNHTISACIRSTLKRKGGYDTKNGRHWEDLVGYTVEQLIKHLEKQFTEEMTWENHGSYWHIDHIIPIAVFNFEKAEDIDFKRCWALENLQPLWASENMSKGAKIDKPFQPSLALRLMR